VRTRPLQTLALGLLASLVTACSSAPAPESLEAVGGDTRATNDSTTAPGSTTAGGGSGSGTGAGAPGTTGGATTTSGAGGGSTSGTTGGGASTTGPAGTTGGTGAVGPGATTGGGTTGAAETPPRSTLFTPAEDRIGITDTTITMCAHAALTYGKAFNTEDADFNVFWTALNEEKGGVHGRKVAVTYENDNYSPTTAVEAARACKAKNPFILLGGIGFDQIPTVRNYVEEQHILYMHHTATVNGTKGQKYSFTALPTVERTGEAFAQLYLQKYKGKKLGIIKRAGDNWEPGVVAFKKLLTAAGGKVVEEKAVPANKGNYTDEILAMKNAGAEVVWGWENALIATQILKQAKAQSYSPHWLLFPFNLTSQTLENDALTPPLDGVAMFTAFSKGDRSGPFAAYADDLAMFEAQYAKYRPGVDLAGVGGDLLFLNWQAQKGLYDILLACGKDCTRNRFVDTLATYKKRPTSSGCPLDFTRDVNRGGEMLTFMQTYKSPSGKVNWRNTVQCVGRP
jgi:hypothetical protein